MIAAEFAILFSFSYLGIVAGSCYCANQSLCAYGSPMQVTAKTTATTTVTPQVSVTSTSSIQLTVSQATTQVFSTTLAYSCSGQCLPGWNGTSCNIDIDECAQLSNPCSLSPTNATVCVNAPGSYICQCATGYQQINSSQNCTVAGSCNCANQSLCAYGSPTQVTAKTTATTTVTPQVSVTSTSSIQLTVSQATTQVFSTTLAYSCSGQCLPGWNGTSCNIDIDECAQLSNPCSLSPTNATVCVNAPGSYICQCATGYQQINSSHNCTAVTLTISGSYGPLAGGSLLSLVFNSNNSIPTTVLLGTTLNATVFADSDYEDFSWNYYAWTPASPSVNVGVPLPISVNISDGSTYKTNSTFTYLQNPSVTAIWPQQYIYTGGILMSVSGANLNTSQLINLQVTMVVQRLMQSLWLSDISLFYGTCFNESVSTTIYCELPAIILPSDFQSLIDSQNNLASGDNLYPAPGNLSAIPNGFLGIYLGLTFDGFTDYSNLTANLTNTATVIYPPPIIPSLNGRIIYDPDINNTLNISGTNMLRGCSIQDYNVTLEGLSCVALKLTNTMIMINFTIEDPSGNVTFPWPCASTDYHLQINVGFQTYPIACVYRIAPCTSSPCLNGAKCKNLPQNTYSCACTKNFYGFTCASPYPTLSNLVPTIGPLVGGTTITISGYIPAPFLPTAVNFTSNISVPVVSSDSSSLVITSPSFEANPSLLNTALNLIVIFNGGNLTRKIGNFTYRPDTILTGIYPRQQLISGGTVLTATGMNVNSVAVPILQITLDISKKANNQILTNKATFSAVCQAENSNILACPMPTLSIPSDVTVYLTPSNNPLDFQNSRSLAINGFTLIVYVGFLLDGITAYRNMSTVVANATLAIYQPPIIPYVTNSSNSFTTNSNVPFQVQGINMTTGCSMSDYSISIAGKPCNVVALTFDYVDCIPYNVTPVWNISAGCPMKNTYQLIVSVGYQQYQLGCLMYISNSTYDACRYVSCLNGGHCENQYANTTFWGCVCTSAYYGSLCQYSRPVVQGLSPWYGPEQGGTVVTIGVFLQTRLIALAVNFANCTSTNPITNYANNQVVVTTPTCFADQLGAPVPVTIILNSSGLLPPLQVNQTFTFFPNPVITSIGPRDQLRTGGTIFTVSGTNLDSSYEPVITMTMVIIRLTASNIYQIGQASRNNYSTEYTYKTPDCFTNTTTMVCSMPSFPLDPDVITSLNNIGDIGGGNDRRKRDVTGQIDENRERSKRSVGTLVSENVYFGVVFDGFTYYSNLSAVLPNSSIQLHNPPQFNVLPNDPSSFINFFPNTGQIVEIEGTNLLVGSQMEDYTVYVENATCSIVYIDDLRIQFVPPPNISFVLSDQAAGGNCTASYHVVISVGEYEQVVACMIYETTLPIYYNISLGYIGAAFGGAILIVIAVVCTTKARGSGQKK